jgi:O-antigen/teichoic acid export membrane protein
MGFIPYLTSLFNRGEVEQLRMWLERLGKWVTLASMLALLTWLFLGDSLVLLIFGRQYRPVVLNLLPLLAALPMVALSNVARMLALIQNRPGIAFSAATLQVATFWLAGVPLAARGGSFATCMTVLIASAVYGIYFTLRIRSHLKYSLKGWCAPLLMAIPFLALIFLRGSIVLNLSLWIAAVTGYSFFLISCRIISPQDFQLFRMAFTASGGIERHPHQKGTPD